MSRPASVLHKVGLLTGLSVLAGLLVAALSLPLVGSLGWAAKTSNSHLDDLPLSLVNIPLAQHSIMRAADGTPIAVLAGAEDRVVVPLSAIPAAMQQAIVAIEDNRFYEHKGVDVRSLLRAAKQDSGTGQFTQGASTITQQYVKQALLEEASNSNATAAEKKDAQRAATEKSVGRKLREARYAIALEKKLSKAQILERYLNIAYFGQGVYGVGTAAEHYFGIPVQKLSLAQAALLAGLVNSPSAFDPTAYPKAAKERRNLVLDAVAKYHFLPQATVNKALATPMVVHPAKKSVDSCATSQAPYFCRYVLDNLLQDKALGATATQRQQTIFEGGLDIYTTLNLKTQQAVDHGIRSNVSFGIRQVQSVASIEPGTGRIVAIGQNRDYGVAPGQSKNVYAAVHDENVGSTFKAVTLMAALAQGLPTSTHFYAPACLKGFGYASSTNPRCPGGVTNAGDSESGNFDMVRGTWESVNTYFIQLEHTVGVFNVRDMAKKLGDLSPGIDKNDELGPSLTLGAANGLSPIDMATMYATIAAHGKECDPRMIDKITTVSGKAVPFTQPAACHQVVDSSVADTTTAILQGVLNQPGATAAGQGLDRPAAGKTGTLDNSTGAWFVGYVPQLATAVGIFDPLRKGDPITPITSVQTGQTYSAHIYGGDIPAQTWHTIMTQAVQDLPVQGFAIPQQFSYAPTPGPPNTGRPAPSTSATASPSTPASTPPSGKPSGKPTKPSPRPKRTIPPPPPA